MDYRKKVKLVIGTRARRHVTHVTRKRASVLISNHALSRPTDGLFVFTYLNVVTDCRRDGRSGDGGRPANGAPRFCCQQSTCCFRTVESTAFIFIYLHSYYFDADRFAERLAPSFRSVTYPFSVVPHQFLHRSGRISRHVTLQTTDEAVSIKYILKKKKKLVGVCFKFFYYYYYYLSAGPARGI